MDNLFVNYYNYFWGGIMHLGQLIRQYRKQKKFTLQDLADKIGTFGGVISLIENGKRNPSLNMLHAIAKALEIPISSLLDNDANIVMNKVNSVQNNEKVLFDNLSVHEISHNYNSSAVEILVPDDSMNIYFSKGSIISISLNEPYKPGDLVAVKTSYNIIIRKLMIFKDKLLLIPISKNTDYQIEEVIIENILGKVISVSYKI